MTGKNTETYLKEGQSTNGVVYFEQPDTWGGCFPSPSKKGLAKIRVSIVDTFGKEYKKTVRIPVVSWVEAKKYNPSFGNTFSTIRNEDDLRDFLEIIEEDCVNGNTPADV